MYGHPQLVATWAAAHRRNALRRLVALYTRRALLVVTALLVLAALCYVGPSHAAFDPVSWPHAQPVECMKEGGPSASFVLCLIVAPWLALALAAGAFAAHRARQG